MLNKTVVSRENYFTFLSQTIKPLNIQFEGQQFYIYDHD